MSHLATDIGMLFNKCGVNPTWSFPLVRLPAVYLYHGPRKPLDRAPKQLLAKASAVTKTYQQHPPTESSCMTAIIPDALFLGIL